MRRDLVRLAATVDPSVAEALEAALLAAADAVEPQLLDAVSARVGLLLGDETDGAPLDDACLRLVEQFVMDVSEVADKDIGDVAELMSNGDVYGLVAALYMFELTRRAELALGAALDGNEPAP